MQIKEFQQNVVKTNNAFCKQYGFEATSQENIMRMMLKLGEENGELCEAVLAGFGMQRKDKLDIHSIDDIKGELADVIVTAMTLAVNMNIDIEEILVDKIRLIEKRISDKA